jgi:hypothetical protein
MVSRNLKMERKKWKVKEREDFILRTVLLVL